MDNDRFKLNELLRNAELEYPSEKESYNQAREYIINNVKESFTTPRFFGKYCNIVDIQPQQYTYPVLRDNEVFFKDPKEDIYKSIRNETILILNFFKYVNNYFIPHEAIYDLIEIPIDHYGTDLAVKENDDIINLLVNCAVKTVSANIQGKLNYSDIFEAKSCIEYIHSTGLLLHPNKWADLAKKIINLRERLETDEIILYQTPKSPVDTSIVFDFDKLYIFEREPIRIGLKFEPARDGWFATVIKRYLPVIIDRDSVVKIENC